jgi:toxin-antitoxin system PIN domain toxin
MIAPDANLLIYAHDPASPFHVASRDWLEQVLSASEPVGFPILALYGFLRFVTNAGLASRPLSFQQACAVINSWLDQQHTSSLHPGQRHWDILQKLSNEAPLRGNLITDAAIVAIAEEHGATIYSHDRDFARFPGLRWLDPLAK